MESNNEGQRGLLVNDLKRRIPNVLSDAKLLKNTKNIDNFLKWIKESIIPLDNSLPHSGALGMYVFTK